MYNYLRCPPYDGQTKERGIRMEDFIEKVKTGLLAIGIGLFVCFGWIALMSVLLSNAFEIIPLYKLGFMGICIESLITIVVLGLSLIILLLVKGFKTRCPSCKKLFAMKENGTELLYRKPKYVKVINNTYSKYSGKVAYESEQLILGTEKTLRTQYICKYCHAEKSRTFYQSTSEPWQE